MRKKFIAQAVTLYDMEEQMVIGTIMISEPGPIPWMPSDGILLFNGDGYDSDAGYTVYVLPAGEEQRTNVRVYINEEVFNACIQSRPRSR